MTKLKVATGQKFGATAKIEHITDAVQNALDNAGLTRASSVLLFLSNGYIHEPKAALKAAVKKSGTLQIFGATAAGLLTEKDWLLDQEGAVAMVFPKDCDLQPESILAMQQQVSDLPMLCLTSLEYSKVAINHLDQGMVGAVTSNLYGESKQPIWQASQISKKGFSISGFNTADDINLKSHTVISQGVRRISGNLCIDSAKNTSIEQLSDETALDSLTKSIPENVYSLFLEQPHHTLCAVSESDDESAPNALHHDFYKLFNVVSLDKKNKHVSITGKVKNKQHCFWALRDKGIAKQEMQSKLKELANTIKKPAFAFMFTSESRGPYFFSNKNELEQGKEHDRDLELFQKYFPDTPLIGIYSNGEISQGSHFKSLLRRYSCVLTVFEKE